MLRTDLSHTCSAVSAREDVALVQAAAVKALGQLLLTDHGELFLDLFAIYGH